MIDIFSLSRVVGGVTLQKGLDYARRGAVSDIEITEKPLRLSGSIRGSHPLPYRATVSLSMTGPSIITLTGICSCPVRLNCKHVAALVISGLSVRGEQSGPVRPAWERALAPVVEEESERTEADVVPVGLQFELMPFAGDPAGRGGWTEVPKAARLGVRPVLLGGSGKWVRTGISWSSLGYSSYGRHRPDPDHLEWLAALASVANGNAGRYYGSVPAWVQLDTATGTAVWDLLARATELGISLIGSDKSQSPVIIASERADVFLDLATDGSGMTLEAVVRAGNEPEGVPAGLMLGEPARAVAFWPAAQRNSPLRERQLRLAMFRTPPSRELIALVTAGAQRIPEADVPKFLGTYLPVLRRRARLVSPDHSFRIPAPVPPELLLTVTHLQGHRAGLRWGWRYAGADDDEPLWPRFGAAAYRDPEVERKILSGLPEWLSEVDYLTDLGRLVGETTLLGMQAIGFLTGVLPELEAHPLVHVEIRGEASYREATSPAVIGISGEAVEGRDWFDLQISITVDEEEVPLREVFLALARDQEYMILPSGTYFPLDAKKFEQLRKLIDEARLLQDGGGEKSLRVSRFQASLWDELQELGIVDEQAAAWNRAVRSLMVTADMQRQDLPPGFQAVLRPYQQEGFDWLSFLFDSGLGGILADDMGLGKTIQALALISRAVARPEGSAPFLVVAPTSVVGNWKSEATKFAPGLKVAAVNETASRRGVSIADLAAESDVLVTSYALFRLEFDRYAEQEWAGLVLDEAQFVKNHQSLGFKNAKRLPAGFKLAITGTPMENNLMELWSLFSITSPGLFGSPAKFAEFFSKPIEKLGDTESLSRLRRRIRPLMLRRTKDQVVDDLPPKQEQVIELELNPRHLKVYQTHLQRERQKVLGLIDDMDKNRFAIFRSLTLLRRLSLDPSLVDEKYAAIPSTKLDALMEQLDDVVAEGHRVLVFSQFTSFLGRVRTRLDDAGIDYCYLDGNTRRRPEVLERFTSGTAPVFLISLKAGGFGLNLTEADYCILLDPWWNPASENQAIDRAHRIGQHKTVMVYRLVSKGTIEQKVMALKEGKAKLFSSVMSDDGAEATALTADDIRGLLS